MAQLVKNPPAIWETWVSSLGWEDPLEREKLPTPVFWPGECSPWGSKESDTTEQLSLGQVWAVLHDWSAKSMMLVQVGREQGGPQAKHRLSRGDIVPESALPMGG